MNSEVVVKASGLHKKFCRNLKKSLKYGIQDVLTDLNPFGKHDSSVGLRNGEFWALSEVSFELRRGECLGLIGHNGAGKTTLLKMLNGLIPPDFGQVEMRGRVGALIALGAGFNPILTGLENIYVNGAVVGMSKAEIDSKFDEIVEFADIGKFIDAPVQSYSSGMVVRLGFAVAAAWRPDVLLLDEVLAVGDMAFQAKCFNRIGEFRRQGTGFILVTHNMHQVTRFCDRVLYLKGGKPVYIGDTAKAIELFHHEMLEKQASSQSSSSEPPVTGSGAVVLERAYFINEVGEKIHHVDALQTVTLCVDYTCHREGIRNPVLDIVVYDSEDLCFQGTNRSFGIELGPLSNAGTIRVRFERLPSNNQNLRFNMALWDSNFSELYDWKRDTRLRVNGNPKCSGRVLINSKWTVESKESQVLGHSSVSQLPAA